MGREVFKKKWEEPEGALYGDEIVSEAILDRACSPGIGIEDVDRVWVSKFRCTHHGS